MLWILIVAALLALGVVAKRPPAAGARSGWLAVLALFACALLATRLGPRALLVALPFVVSLGWRWLQAPEGAKNQAPRAPSSRGMTREDALRVLGLREGASREAIASAHRSLIKKVHPDHGGSDHLAEQVNEAKRVLESPVVD